MSLAAYTRNRGRMLAFQTADCALLAIAQVIFEAPAGAAALIIGAVRNILMLKNRFGFGMMLIFSSGAAVLGLLTNTKGLIGFIPVIATLVLTVGLYRFRSPRGAKLVIFLNLLLWSVYSVFISDLATAVSNGASALICLITVFIKEKE